MLPFFVYLWLFLSILSITTSRRAGILETEKVTEETLEGKRQAGPFSLFKWRNKF